MTGRCLLPELMLLLLLPLRLPPQWPQPLQGRRRVTAAPSLHQVNPPEPLLLLLLLLPGWLPSRRPHLLRGRGVTAAAPHQMMQPP